MVTTKGLIGLVQGQQAPCILFDVLGQPEALPNAVPAAWLSQPGTFNDSVQQQAAQMLGQGTQGRKDVALVFYCLSRECWMSYNAALRAINAGYTNVLWYRGGIEAWKMAGLPTQQGNVGQAGQLAQQGQPSPQGQRMQPGQQILPGQPVQPGVAQQAGNLPPAMARGEPGKAGSLPSKFVEVKPVARDSASGVGGTGGAGGAKTSRPTGELRIGQGRFFSFALPTGDGRALGG